MIFPAADPPSTEPKPTALFSAIATQSESNSWTSVNGWVVPRTYTSVDQEYAALTRGVAVADFGPLSRYIVRGDDAAALLARITTAPLTSLNIGEGARGLVIASSGAVADIVDVARLGREMYLMTSSQPHGRRLQLARRGFHAVVEDITGRIAALALIGPMAREAAAACGLSSASDTVAAQTVVRGVETATRPIHMGVQPGVEIIYPNDDALTIWERVRRAAGPTPAGLDALEVLRIEGGAPRPGVDFWPADSAPSADKLRTPDALGLPHLAPLNRAWFNGRRALQAMAVAAEGRAARDAGIDASSGVGQGRRAVTLALDAESVAVGAAVFSGEAHVGYLTSVAFSPRMRRIVAFADLAGHAGRGPLQAAGAMPGERIAVDIHESAEARLADAFLSSLAA